MAATARDAMVDHRLSSAWAERDLACALHPLDRSVIRSTEVARSLVLDLLRSAAHARDLFNACARLGGLMAEAGASPSLVAGVIDSAARTLDDAAVHYDPSRIGPARSSTIEGYVAAVSDAERLGSSRRWEYPACAVDLGGGTVAITCGHPGDGEAISEWATRVAGALVKQKARRAVLGGPRHVRAEVGRALGFVGIEVTHERDVGPDEEDSATDSKLRRWLRLPWRK